MKNFTIVLALLIFVCTNHTLAASSSSNNDLLIAQQEVKKKVDPNEPEESDDIEDEEIIMIGDPLRGFNDAMYRFNDKLYFWVLKPVASVWKVVIPTPFRVAIKNVFYNLRFPVRFVNSLLQGKGQKAKAEVLRFLFNTTAGIGGLGDPAKDIANLNPSEEDLGQTFAVWGVGNGFYLVWPFFGPYTLRDSFGKLGDIALDPLTYFTYIIDGYDFVPHALSVGIGEVVNDTSFRIGDYEAIKEAAIVPYEALKDAYIQNRNKKIAE